MNLTPSNWPKSEITIYKSFIKKGMRLFPTGGGAGQVMGVDGDSFLFRSEDDINGEWEEWYNADDLQLGWSFTMKDLDFIKAIIKN